MACFIDPCFSFRSKLQYLSHHNLPVFSVYNILVKMSYSNIFLRLYQSSYNLRFQVSINRDTTSVFVSIYQLRYNLCIRQYVSYRYSVFSVYFVQILSVFSVCIVQTLSVSSLCIVQILDHIFSVCIVQIQLALELNFLH